MAQKPPSKPQEKKKEPVIQTVARNRKAGQRFFIQEAFEAGIALQGHEVKSLRQGKASIEDGVIQVVEGQMKVYNVYIPPYTHLAHVTPEPTRPRQLLMHRREIDKLGQQVQTKGMTLIPLEVYFKDGRAKVKVGLCKGKKTEDRREEIKKRDVEREIRRNVAR